MKDVDIYEYDPRTGTLTHTTGYPAVFSVVTSTSMVRKNDYDTLQKRLQEIEARCITLFWMLPNETLTGELQDKLKRVMTNEVSVKNLTYMNTQLAVKNKALEQALEITRAALAEMSLSNPTDISAIKRKASRIYQETAKVADNKG